MYDAKGEDTQGFGSAARGYGSIGLLMDRKGLDTYRLGIESGLALPGGQYGVRIDWPLLGVSP